MARSIDPNVPAVPEPAARHPYPGLDTWEKEIRVVTPLFGGGSIPRTNDPVTVIRPSAIRGHLRFWWRATQGARFTDATELRKTEGTIWGTTDDPSKVVVEVQITKPGRPEACATFPPDKTFPRFASGYPPYALFPFQGNKKDGIAPATAVRDVEFRLTVRYPSGYRIEVMAALWAWTNFGGIGARTRRGCGALLCDATAPKTVASVANWWKAGRTLSRAAPGGSHAQWPTLDRAPLLTQSAMPAMAAWEAAVALMREFRQGENTGRNRGTSPNRPGRSRWPEADSLRTITGEGDARHLPAITVSTPAFPRAELGLPIVFHFKDYQDAPNNSELYPADHGESRRMASPVILRPLGIAGGSQALPMVLVLDAPAPEELELHFDAGGPASTGMLYEDTSRRFSTRQTRVSAPQIRRPDLASYASSPMAKRSGSGSALEAFAAFAREKGFREVRAL